MTRADRYLAAYQLGRRAGIIQGANELLQEAGPGLPPRHHRKLYDAFLRIYDRYRAGGPGGRLTAGEK